MTESVSPELNALAADHASRQLTTGEAGRLAVALVYLLAVAIAAEATAVLLGVLALAGLIVAALVVRFSREVREAMRVLAALGLASSKGGPDRTAALLVLLVSLLASAAAWRALSGRAAGIASVVALLLFAWQWWFYFYGLAPPADHGASRKESHRD